MRAYLCYAVNVSVSLVKVKLYNLGAFNNCLTNYQDQNLFVLKNYYEIVFRFTDLKLLLDSERYVSKLSLCFWRVCWRLQVY